MTLSESPYAEDLNRRVRAVLSHAVTAHRDGNKVYESLRNLNDVIGTEYGDRVLYELIQNAHDAHRADDQGRIAVKLVVRSESDGTLYVANGGGGFRKEDVDAIVNLATTAKGNWRGYRQQRPRLQERRGADRRRTDLLPRG